MKYKGQCLASAVTADPKSTVTDEFEENVDNNVFKSMLSQQMNNIVDGASE